MISMRGQAADYDHWRQLGLPAGAGTTCCRLFRRLEDHFLGESEHHGAGGELAGRGAAAVAGTILDAVRRRRRARWASRAIADFNTGDNEGVGYFHVNQKRGCRWSAARGFLKPVLKRANLRLETGRAGRPR